MILKPSDSQMKIVVRTLASSLVSVQSCCERAQSQKMLMLLSIFN